MADEVAPALPQSLTLDHVSPATRLLEKRRQMFEVQEALDAQKEEFARREEAFRRREEGLRKKDLDLQESLIRFNKFLQENESKRTRAEKRANDERQFRLEKSKKVKQLLKELEQAKADSKALEEQANKNRKYQEYLETVLDAYPDDYPEISNILDRYKTLKDTHDALEERRQVIDASMEVQRNKANALKTDKEKMFLNSNNLIAHLKKILEATEAESSTWSRQVDDTRRSLRGQVKELGQVLLAVSNLKTRCSFSRHNPKGSIIKHGRNDESDAQPRSNADDVADRVNSMVDDGGRKTMEELDVIQAYIVDFRKLVQQAQKEADEAYATADAPSLEYAGAVTAEGGSGAGHGGAQRGAGLGSPSASASASASARGSSTGERSRQTNA